jgi:hypothetical protein
MAPSPEVVARVDGVNSRPPSDDGTVLEISVLGFHTTVCALGAVGADGVLGDATAVGEADADALAGRVDFGDDVLGETGIAVAVGVGVALGLAVGVGVGARTSIEVELVPPAGVASTDPPCFPAPRMFRSHRGRRSFRPDQGSRRTRASWGLGR